MVTDAPPDLLRALESYGARITLYRKRGLRRRVEAESQRGRLIATYSMDPEYGAVVRHEVSVRGLVGTDGPLRAPEVLEHGAMWILQVAIQPEPWVGAGAVDAVLSAAATIPGLPLRQGPHHGQRKRHGAMRRRVRTLLSSIPVRDVVLARRALQRSTLPLVPSHGDFHVKNAFLARGAVWVVDWERSGLLPAGDDLMRFWTTLESHEDRARLFEGALDLVGRRNHIELSRLRYAEAVRTVVNWVGANRAEEAYPEGARRLLSLLPELRREANLP
jgi:hypothetical protein